MILFKKSLPFLNVAVLIGGIAFMFFNCNLSRSSLIDDPKYPYACKTILDDSYLKQNNPGSQSSVSSMIGESCKGSLSTIFCSEFVEARYSNKEFLYKEEKFILCMAKQGK